MGYNEDGDWSDEDGGYGGGGRNAPEMIDGLWTGAHPARAVPNKIGNIIDFGRSQQKKTPFASVVFEFSGGQNKGKRIEWTGYLSKGAMPYTIKNLRTMGWVGDDIDQIKDLPNDVELVLGVEEYTNDRGKTYRNLRIKFVNEPGGVRGVKDEDRIPRDELKRWAAELKASGDINRPPPERADGGRPAPRQPEPGRHPNAPPIDPNDDIPF